MADIKSAFKNFTEGNYIQAEVELKEILTNVRDEHLKKNLDLTEDDVDSDEEECKKKEKKEKKEEKEQDVNKEEE